MDEVDEDRGEDGGWGAYPPFEEIDFSRIYSLFRELVLFDDLFLSMQGLNVGLTDQSLTAWEYDLLREYIEIERTPTSTAVMVSAWSQMWIFALYELLRTWRDRIRHLNELQRKGSVEQYILKELPVDELNPAATMRRHHAERLLRDPTFVPLLKDHEAKMAPVYKMTETIRMNLAKHVLPKSGTEFPRAPGYGRINSLCGAMDYEVQKKGGYYSLVNRRDIAEALRRVKLR